MREGGVTLKFDLTKPFSKINKDQSGNLISTSFSFWNVSPRQLWPGLGSLEEQQVRAIYLIRYSRLSFVTSTCQTRFRWPVKGQLRPCWIINLPTLLLLKLKKTVWECNCCKCLIFEGIQAWGKTKLENNVLFWKNNYGFTLFGSPSFVCWAHFNTRVVITCRNFGFNLG